MPSNNSKHLIFTGDRFSRLTVISFSHHDKRWRRHYLTRCDCGQEKTVQGTLLRSGNTRSCGCLSREVKALTRKPENGSEITAVILGYKRHADRRGFEWALSREQVRVIIGKRCHYCGAEPSNMKATKNSITPFVYGGIDRINNKVGYLMENVVPCCAVCNRAKGVLTPQEFYAWVKRINAMASQWGKL